jgi:hypothetical protein
MQQVQHRDNGGLQMTTSTRRPSRQGKRTYATKWDYFVVSTPDFPGPFRGRDSTFRAPVAVDVATPGVESSRNGVIALLEVIVSSDGSTQFEAMLKPSGSRSTKRIRDVVNRWRFEPARLDGRAIRVRLRVTVSNDKRGDA